MKAVGPERPSQARIAADEEYHALFPRQRPEGSALVHRTGSAERAEHHTGAPG